MEGAGKGIPTMPSRIVLVVDDDPEVRHVLRELLEIEGYEVRLADGGLSALLRIGRDVPDCVVLDLKLQDISGFEVYRALRAETDFRALPVLFISGAYHDEEWIRRQMGCGPYAYLAKPIDQDDLARVLREIIASQALAS
jgi:CheY-like chemotaxis protein